MSFEITSSGAGASGDVHRMTISKSNIDPNSNPKPATKQFTV